MCIILGPKYKRADLNKVVTKKCQYLSLDESEIHLDLLSRFEDMLDVTLGTWNSKPAYLRLNYDTKPVCFLQYPVPKVHEAMLKIKPK